VKSAFIAGLILQRPMCIDCICTKTTLSATEVDHSLTVIAGTTELQRDEHHRCRPCGKNGPVFSLHRSPS
jgi:hypothetical protein